MPINIAPSSSVRPTGNRSDDGACIAVVFARCGILPAMRRVWLLLWALWLALAPIGSAWAYACVCTGQPALICCKNYTAGEGEPPFAPTPLSHPVGEGLGVRAKTCVASVPREPKCCALINTSRTCCAVPAEPCNGCAGCSLERAKPAPASASVSRIALEWADCVLDAPALQGLTRVEPLRACFGLPVVRNHSPPREPSAPRAPPLCCVC